MFGTLRFVLASLVVANHAGFVSNGFNVGPVAVVIFYIISGFVISYLLDHRIHTSLLKGFYLERILRIYPPFLFHLAVSVLLIVLTDHVSQFSSVRPDIMSIGSNLFLLPLQARVFSEYLTGILYVPTSWSLSLEFSFYMVAPWLLRSRGLLLVTAASYLLFLTAILGLVPPRPHVFSYATIFGTLHFFVVGVWIQRRNWWLVWFWFLAIAFAIIPISVFASWRPSHVEEVIIGGLLGVPMVVFLRSLNVENWSNFDQWLGRVSFPVFLNHFIFIWLFQALNIQLSFYSGLTLILTCSWIFGHIAYVLVELPMNELRRRLRA